MNKQKKAFTLVELVVTVIIMMILSTVGFVSFQGYLSTVRDSAKIIEIDNMKTSLNKYYLNKSSYPYPDDLKEVTYSGSTVWYQGGLGLGVLGKMNYSKDPVVDPYTENPYTYSIKNSRKEYQIGAVLENFTDEVFNTTNAAGDIEGEAYVTGDYNGELITVKGSFGTNILAIPSIISTDLSSTDITYIISNNRFVYNGYTNLPETYKDSEFILDGGNDFSANNLVVYSGSMNSLKQGISQMTLLRDVRDSYSGTTVSYNIDANRLIDDDYLIEESSGKAKIVACNIVNFKLKYFVECAGVDFITFYIINVLKVDITKIPGNISVVYQESDDIVVFGSNKGITFYNLTNDATTNYTTDDGLVHDNVTTISKVGATYWIGTVNGVSTFDGNTTWLTQDSDSLVSTHIQYIFVDSNNTVWIGTNNGVSAYDGTIWNSYTKKSSGLTHNNITAIYTDSNNDVWFGTNSKGIDKYEIDTDTVTNYTTNDLPNKDVTYIYEDSSNNVWVGTVDGLAYTSDYGNNWTKKTDFSNNNITYIFEDSTNNIWIGTNNGVSKYNGTLWSSSLSGNEVYSIYEDENGNILILSDGGLDTL